MNGHSNTEWQDGTENGNGTHSSWECDQGDHEYHHSTQQTEDVHIIDLQYWRQVTWGGSQTGGRGEPIHFTAYTMEGVERGRRRRRRERQVERGEMEGKEGRERR